MQAAGEKRKLVFLHYPPRYKGYTCQPILDLLAQYQVRSCYYGHLHSASHALAVEGIWDGIDYRLVSSRVLEEFSKYKEVNMFLRGMFPLVGFKSTCVYYERHERIAGKSHYPLKKMLALAFDGITSLSIKPIRIITGIGFAVALASVVGIIWSIITAISGNSIAGWASSISIMCFLGGIQLLSLGVIGEYIGKNYLETKARPKFIISNRTTDQTEVESDE